MATHYRSNWVEMPVARNAATDIPKARWLNVSSKSTLTVAASVNSHATRMTLGHFTRIKYVYRRGTQSRGRTAYSPDECAREFTVALSLMYFYGAPVERC